MKKTTLPRISLLLAGALFSAATAWAATNYSAMSNEELAAKRGAMQGFTLEERNAFQQEWQKRLQQMSPEEHQKYMRGQGTGPGANPPNTQVQERIEQRQQIRSERQETRQEQRGGGMGGRR